MIELKKNLKDIFRTFNVGYSIAFTSDMMMMIKILLTIIFYSCFSKKKKYSVNVRQSFAANFVQTFNKFYAFFSLSLIFPHIIVIFKTRFFSSFLSCFSFILFLNFAKFQYSPLSSLYILVAHKENGLYTVFSTV